VDFALSPEQQALRDSVRGFARRYLEAVRARGWLRIEDDGPGPAVIGLDDHVRHTGLGAAENRDREPGRLASDHSHRARRGAPG